MHNELYFAYGSNMDLDQMDYRCPESEVIGPVRLDGYKLAFRGAGFATILPCEGGSVEGVLWRISEMDERRLDRYEGYPRHYDKRTVQVLGKDGAHYKAMVYEMCPPLRDQPALPRESYLNGILLGCRQNGLPLRPVREALQETQTLVREQELPRKIPPSHKGRAR